MANTYGVAFSNTDPRNYTSLAPTFLIFNQMSDGASLARPAISQLLAHGITYTGIYQFTYTASTSVYFLLDAITTSTASDRYVYGILDPVQRVDQRLEEIGSTVVALGNTAVALGTTGVAIGTTGVALGTTAVAIGTSVLAASQTLVAIGNTLGTLDARIGTTSSTFGTSATDPGDLYGYMKRIQEFLEGDATFTKSSGAWAVKSRGGSLLASKTLTNTSTTVTKD